MERLALVADTHTYRAGLPALLAFFKDQGLRHLACLGDCPPEPFRPWLTMDPGNRLYWVYDVFGPQMPEATGCGIALELEGRIFLAHTRALIWTHYNERIRAYGHGAHTYRPPMLACHGHTHVPCVTRFTPPFSRLLYTNDAVRPQEFQPRQACLPWSRTPSTSSCPGPSPWRSSGIPPSASRSWTWASSRVAMVSLKDWPAWSRWSFSRRES